MAKRKANASEELRVLKARIAELEEQTNVSEAFEQSRNEVDDDGVQIVEIQGQIEADPQQKKFRENISKMKEELSNTEQLCMITELENKLLQSKLKHHELMEEQNELQAKVAKMVDHQQQKKNKQGRREDEQAELKAICGRLDDLEKQQQMFMETGNENALAKIERMDNFIAILKDRFRNDLLKAVHPNLRQNFVDNFLNSLPKNCWDANACDDQLRIIDDKCLTVRWWSEEEGCSSVFAKHPFPTCSSGTFYYEIKILRMNGNTRFSIGLASKAMPLDDCVGNHWDSYGYQSNGDFRTSGSVWLNDDPHPFSRGAIIGCGVNLASRRIIFTHNGRQLDTSDLFLSPSSVGPWFPCISLSDETKIVANFGPNFKFDPTKIVAPSNSLEKNCWDADACDSGLKITDNECLTVHYNEEKIHWLTVFAKHSILVPNYADFFYFEIKVKNMNKGVFFGFTTKQKHGELDGHVRHAYGIFGYQSDGVLWTSGSGVTCTKFVAGSVVGCGINLNNRQLIFTRNGHRLDDDDDYRVPSSVGPLFPFVTLFAVGEKI